MAEDVIMVTSSIMKDMQPNLEVIYRPNAIRALCRIIDVSLATPLRISVLLMLLYSRPWFKVLNASSRLPSSTRTRQYRPRHSSRPITSSRLLKTLSSDGSTKLRKPSMPRTLRRTSQRHRHLPPVILDSRHLNHQVLKPYLRPATSLSTTPSACSS